MPCMVISDQKRVLRMAQPEMIITKLNQTKLLAHIRSLKRPTAIYVSEIARNDLNDIKKLLENETRSNKTVSLIVVPTH
jgi:hypothetical protein